jgi:hypothetical protein
MQGHYAGILSLPDYYDDIHMLYKASPHRLKLASDKVFFNLRCTKYKVFCDHFVMIMLHNNNY